MSDQKSLSASRPIRLFSTDLDGTLLGNPEAANRFATAWSSLPAATRPLLVYNSGRLLDDTQRLITTGELPAPDYIIGGVGTQIHDARANRTLTEFADRMSPGWDLEKVKAVVSALPVIRPQPDHFQHAFKSSWFFENATPLQLETLEQQLAAAGLDTCVVYSSNRDLDVIPRHANKGGALSWLCARLGIATDEVLVAGDTGNDAGMFRLPGVRGIIVQNAHPELFTATVDIPIYTSGLVMADGVLEGLRHYGIITRAPSAGQSGISAEKMSAPFRQLFTGTQLGSLSDDEKKLIHTGYEKALVALRKNITPLGFSACSLADNAVTGTDINYRSVWARDGSMTVIYTLDLEDSDIRAAQKATLETLLSAASPSGQIPANVRIDNAEADYGGVGNICSIDSGLWVIIAVYNYVNKTNDLDFLRAHIDRLQIAMNWLSAHDSNNDGLLEIPEAGDWTDLFGRSYNVLYDEVLWYRTNVCFGRLLEFLGRFEHAADYLRWSQKVRARVLDTFWPTTRISDPKAPPANRFADRQFGLGDTQYLLAEITPFSFNWRCDVYANVLAFLMHVLDIDRARTAFRFMWGVGVNNPWPVSNLYPVVQAGDPDWRSYYTVNLLNLPNHYHNGGIWPFVGGMWVRFIHQLGFHDVACRELLQLTKLNKLGRDQEWEFNEWAHGITGRPMGKAFQAWSAASFIKACHELEATPTNEPRD
ncbi:glycogen debranching protein [Nibricoccus aquaticus]|uniref:Glycogen debranching protein n=1 Tax=Nibricoccus aquaticus TaxID=2576891 RepID=A0A290QMX9_9BACT|nr:HAD-IIB family hydrolase [Nibricoccus aquaticus]ATC66041.1 glycogen debranching protein [Nibricoccus aquaticus]